MIDGPLLQGQRIEDGQNHEAEVLYLSKSGGRIWVVFTWRTGPLRGDQGRMLMEAVRTEFSRKSEDKA